MDSTWVVDAKHCDASDRAWGLAQAWAASQKQPWPGPLLRMPEAAMAARSRAGNSGALEVVDSL
jgi:hypothetical protein